MDRVRQRVGGTYLVLAAALAAGCTSREASPPPAVIVAIADLARWDTHAHAMDVLRSDPDASVPALIAELGSIDESERARASLALRAIGAPAVRRLERVAREGNGVQGAAAAFTLASLDATRGLPLLIEATADPDPQARAEAVRRLSQVPRDGTVTAAQARALADPDDGVRAAAIEALAQAHEPGRRALLAALDGSGVETRRDIARALLPRSPMLMAMDRSATLEYVARKKLCSRLVPLASEALPEKVGPTPHGAIAGICECGGFGAPMLAELLAADPDEHVRRTVAMALGRAGARPDDTSATTTASEALAATLANDPSASVRAASASALRTVAEGSGRKGDGGALVAALDDPDPAVPRAAVEALVVFPEAPAAIPRLLADFEDGQFYARVALPRAGSLAIEPLARILHDASRASPLRVAAASALGVTTLDHAVDRHLVRHLDAPDVALRCTVAMALAERRHPDGLPALVRLVGEDDEQGQRWAALALWKLSGRGGFEDGVVPFEISGTVRENALIALRTMASGDEMGAGDGRRQRAASTRPVLHELRRSTDPDTRAWAEQALATIADPYPDCPQARRGPAP